MSQTTAPQMEGQESPNPLELFWEKNKRLISAGCIAVVLAIAANYGVQYMERQQRNELWSAFATSTGLDRGYSEDGSFRWMLRQDQRFGSQVYFSQTFSELITELGADVKNASDTMPDVVASDPRTEPLWIWVRAQRAIEEQDWDGAETRLRDLQTRFPDHFLCATSDFPPQWRKEIEKEEDEGEETTPDPNEVPEYEPPVAGSALSLLLAQIAEQRSFRAENQRFFEPTEPESTKSLVLEFEQAGETLGPVKIRFYEAAAPQHVARILELAETEEPFWQGLRVHEIQREGTDSTFGTPPSQMAFGWTSTRGEDDSSKWLPGDVEEENVVEWEGIDAGLSHFPGTVAVASHTEGKSQVERIVINGADVAGSADGTRVIVGRVVEGLDVIQRIIDDSALPSDEAERSGRGKPADRITIQKVTVE